MNFKVPESLIYEPSLSKGWEWIHYDDGSGSLISPSGNTYYNYDLQTKEYRLPYGRNDWTSLTGSGDQLISLTEFKKFAENELTERAFTNDIFPKLSEEERTDLLSFNSSLKERDFTVKNLNISISQRQSYLEKMEYGTTNGDYSLTEQQLKQLPDFVDRHHLSKNDKYELAYGLLEKQQYAEAYSILPEGRSSRCISMRTEIHHIGPYRSTK